MLAVIAKRRAAVAILATSALVGLPVSGASARTITATNPNANATIAATYPATAGLGVAFTSTVRASIADPGRDPNLPDYINFVATRPGSDCPAALAGMKDLAPQFEFRNNGVPATIQGRTALDRFGVWTVCAFLTGGDNEFGSPEVYAVGTLDVTQACTDAQKSVSRAEAALRSARSALRRAKSAAAKARLRARVRLRTRQRKVAKQRYQARVAKACPTE